MPMNQKVVPSLNLGLGQYCRDLSNEFFKHVSKHDESLAQLTVNGAAVINDNKLLLCDELGNTIFDFPIEAETDHSLFSLDDENEKMFQVAVEKMYFKTLHLKNALVPKGFGIEGGRIFIHLFVPLFDNTCLPLLNYFLSAFESGRKNGKFSGFAVRVFALTHRVVAYANTKDDIKKEIEYRDNTEKNIRQIKLLFKEQEDVFHNFYVIDDINRDHLKLDMNKPGLSVVLNEIVLASMLNPYIFGQGSSNENIGSLGVGIIQLDKLLVADYFKAKLLNAGFDKEELLHGTEAKSDYIVNETNKFLGDKLFFFTDAVKNAKKELFPLGFFEFFKEHESEIDKENGIDSLLRLAEKFDSEKTDSAVVECDALANKQVSILEKEINGFTDSFTDNIIRFKTLLGNVLNEDNTIAQGHNNLYSRYTYDDLKHNSYAFFFSLVDENEQVSRVDLNAIQNEIIDLETHLKRLRIEREQLSRIPFEKASRNVSFKEGVFTAHGAKMNADSYAPASKNEDLDFLEIKKDLPLPEAVSLKSFFPPVENQSDLPVAPAFVTCDVYDYYLKRNGIESTTSKSFLYQSVYANNLEHSEGVGTLRLEDFFQQLMGVGVCKEIFWPNVREKFFEAPTEEALEDAENQRIEKVAKLHLDEYEIKSALAEGLPVIVGVKIFKSFFDAMNSGIVPTPESAEMESGDFGFHPMIIVGYSEKEKHFLVRNSWGTAFGDKGYCYLPYQYILDPKLCTEAYVIEKVYNLSLDFLNESVSRTSFFNHEKTEIKRNLNAYYLQRYEDKLGQSKELYRALEAKYQLLTSRIQDPFFRKQLLGQKLDYLRSKKRALIENFRSRLSLNNLEQKEKNRLVGSGGFVFLILLVVIALIVLGILPSLGFLLLFLLIIPGVIAFLSFKKMKRDSVDVFSIPVNKRELLQDMARELGFIENEIQMHRVQFKYASVLMEEAENLRLKISKKYYFTASFIKSLLEWYHEEYSVLHTITFDKPVFVVELAKQDVLNNYFESQKKGLLQNWPSVTEVFKKEYHSIHDFEDHLVLEDAINSSLRKLNSFISQEIKRFDDFDIQAYLLGRRDYEWLPPVETYLSSFVDNLNDMSTPFVQVVEGNVKQPDIDTCLLYGESVEWENEFIETVLKHFSHWQPQPVKIFTGHKVSFLKLEAGLKVDELVVAQANN